MGPFLASRKWDGAHQYGYVFLQGMTLLWVTFTVVYACTVVVLYLKTKGLTETCQHPVHCN